MAKVSSAAKAALGKIGSIDAPSAGFADSYSILLDGTDDHITIDGAGAVISGDTGSISIWFQLDLYLHTTTLFSARIDGVGAPTDNSLWILHHGGTNQLRFLHKGGGTETTIYTTTVVEENGWHHLVCTWDTSENQSALYLDGSSEVTGAAAAFTSDEFDALDFGKRRGWAWEQWPGNMNDIAFFNDALTSGEVSTMYNSGTPKDESSHSGLIGYWKMEENTGTSVADSSSNSNAATLVNGASFASDTP